MDDIRNQVIADAGEHWPTQHCALCEKLFTDDSRPINTDAKNNIAHVDCIIEKDWPGTLNETPTPIPESERPRARPVLRSKAPHERDDDAQ